MFHFPTEFLLMVLNPGPSFKELKLDEEHKSNKWTEAQSGKPGTRAKNSSSQVPGSSQLFPSVNKDYLSPGTKSHVSPPHSTPARPPPHPSQPTFLLFLKGYCDLQAQKEAPLSGFPNILDYLFGLPASIPNPTVLPKLLSAFC